MKFYSILPNFSNRTFILVTTKVLYKRLINYEEESFAPDIEGGELIPDLNR